MGAGGGGAEGNERLTAATAAALFVLLALEGATVPAIGPLLTVHVLVGMVLVPVVLLKIGSTVYRFARYYLGAVEYRRKGPPQPLLRLLGPVLVVLTVVLFASGVALVVRPPSGGLVLLIHKASFIAWFAVTSVHVLVYLWRVPGIALRDWRPGRAGSGSVARRALVATAVLAGLVLAWWSLPWLAPWRSSRLLGG